LYGPTETCINITYYCVNRNDIHEHEIPIGQVIDNNYVYLLDDDLEEVGENQIGMIAIGGINLANCYIKDENLTNDKFIESERYGRLYLTGDLGILSGKGNFYFKGRLDRQVKLRGYRIELEEIESFVNSREYVSQSYIEVVENNNGFSNMRLYVDIDTKNKEILELELKDYFPPYMIPEISCVKGFQFNNSGKIDLLNTKVKDNIMDYIMKLKNLDYLDSQN
ncbi:amino acid adenylation domain-containing protein, partial [Staphylococcus pseudintermedius]|nr:amino acid adenylation domain-containing protein [Staphylococcus pseudintermedius]